MHPPGQDSGDVSEVARVIETIRNEIIDGTRPSGTRLVERSIATDLGVSRLPVREALRRLALEGLVDQRPRAGSVVHPMTPSDIADLNEIHLAFDVLANRQAALRRTPDDLRTLRADVDACTAAIAVGGWADLFQAGIMFRSHVFSAARNSILDEVYATTISRMRRLISAGASTGRAITLYESIYRAIEMQDPDSAENAIITFLSSFRDSHRQRVLNELDDEVESPSLINDTESPSPHPTDEFSLYAPDFTRILPQLRRQIIHGDRGVGSVLSERALAEEFGSSRLPVRQAIEMLASEGLATPNLPRRSSRVKGLDAREADDLIDVVLALDSLTLRLAAQRARRADVSDLREIHREERSLARTGRTHDLLDRIFAFRDRMLETAGNPLLLEVDRVVRSRLRILVAHLPFEETVLRAHCMMRQAVENRDPDLASEIPRRLMTPLRRQEILAPVDGENDDAR